MKISVAVNLHYEFPQPTEILLQIEAAQIPEQAIESAFINVGNVEHFARVSAQDAIGERIWLKTGGALQVDYRATVSIFRQIGDLGRLDAVPASRLPGETVQYLLDSIYCPATRFQDFVEAEFGCLTGGSRIVAMRDWIMRKFTYSPGMSDTRTTALDTFVSRRGVCRDYAHVMIALARASLIPARIASVYALGVKPQDFHVVAEVFLNGSWHLVDATGMAREADMAKIGVGRDAADVSFLTSFGPAYLIQQTVKVVAG